jgi:signal transduction histidine kinase
LLKYQSGRVVALGRVMLGILFLLAVWFDRGDPVPATQLTAALLILYALVAMAITAATWRNWWLDARLAGFAHAFDMAVFTAIVFSANGSTSPFFLFFVLPLLAAAIRWSWRETALTATALIALYLIAGLLVAGSQSFELERFVIRSGHLLILSLLLIWFGIHQRFIRLFLRAEDLESGIGEGQNPLAGALDPTMRVADAGGGALVIGPLGEDPCDGFSVHAGQAHGFSAERPLVRHCVDSALLFDRARDRVLTRGPKGHFRFGRASDLIDVEEAGRLRMTVGLVAEVRTGTQHGWLVLWGIPDLSVDYLEFGRELGRAAGAILDRHALLAAIETGAAARTRLSLARDVHDSIVQFLAGAAFRVEAIKRSARPGAAVAAELDELKRLLVEEQGEIRGFVMALRRGRPIELDEAVAELRALADRLGQQWAIDCRVNAEDAHASIPVRLQLDLQQLLREAVANAVRHGHAKSVELGIAVDDDRLKLSVADDGCGFAKANGDAAAPPWSLKERVERANGSIRLASTPGSTRILITLPLPGAAA